MSTFTVTNTNNSGAGSLRQAVLDANALSGKDIINFGGLFTDGLAHTISLNGGGLSITDHLNIEARCPSLLTIKDDTADRIFDIGKGVTAAINGLTITNSYQNAVGGGAISNEGIFTLSNSTIIGNTAAYDGGGIFNSGSLTVNNSTISGNTADYGGGIFNSGSLTVNNSTISGNTADYASCGIDNRGSLTVNYSSISGNTAGTDGSSGAISNYANGSLTVNYSSIIGNTVYGYGGGIYNYSGSILVSNSTISENSAAGDGNGGGIYSYGGSISVSNSTISGNLATGYLNGDGNGGGIYITSDNKTANTVNTLSVSNSTISGNTAMPGKGVGGGIYILDEGSYAPQYNRLIATVSNSTISDNQAHFGGGIYNDGTLTVSNSTIRHNKAFGSELSTIFGIEPGSYVPGNGGGIYNYSYSTATIDYSTIACNFDTPQQDSTKVIKPDDLVGKFISKGHDNRIGNLSGSTFSYN